MNLHRITQAEKAVRRLELRLGSLLDRELHVGLLDAMTILAEARRFATDFAEADEVEQIDRERAADIHDAAVTRLVQTLRPSTVREDQA